MNQFSIDLAHSPFESRSGARVFGGSKKPVEDNRSGFTRSVWPFLIPAKRDPENPPISDKQAPSGFSS